LETAPSPIFRYFLTFAKKHALKLTFQHKNGIIGTLIFHVLILCFALISEIRQHPPVTFQVLVDPTTLDETPEEEMERLKEELAKEVERLYEQMNRQDIKNVAVNKDYEEQKPTEYKASMTDEEYEREIVRNALNQEEFEKYVENKPTFDDDEKMPELKKPKEKEKPQKSAYKGPATVVYFLEGRSSLYLDIPVYTCEGAAKVAVNIVVNAVGSVTKATVDEQKSVFATDCYRKAALESAKNALFSAAPSGKGNQNGSIVYHFIAQ
jgi:hypothetical protein